LDEATPVIDTTLMDPRELFVPQSSPIAYRPPALVLTFSHATLDAFGFRNVPCPAQQE
jgi:hypothetical protein